MRTLPLLVMLASAPVAADTILSRHPLTVSGTVSAGPCAAAKLFTTEAGERYELDVSRVAVRPGERITVTGEVYPRVSVCRTAPWLDVQRMTRARQAPPADRATTALAAADTLSRPGSADPAMVIVVGHLATLAQDLESAVALRPRLPDTLELAVGVVADPQALFEALTTVAGSRPERLETVHIVLLDEVASSPLLLREADVDRPFASVETVLAAVRAPGAQDAHQTR